MKRLRILVRRTGALGDVFDTTSCVRRLKRENPHSEIDICTQHPLVYWGSPDARYVGAETWFNPKNYDRVFDLDGVQEADRWRVSHRSHSLAIFGDDLTPVANHFSFNPAPPPADFDYRKTIVLHAARSWPQRTLPLGFWSRLAQLLIDGGWNVLLMGTAQDYPTLNVRGVCNAIGRLTLAQQAAVLHNSACLIGSDTGLTCGLAPCTDVPIVCLLTMTLPYIAERERHGQMGWGFYPIVAAVDCAGCTKEITEKVNFFHCKWRDTPRVNECVNAFDPVSVAARAVEVAKQHGDVRRTA